MISDRAENKIDTKTLFNEFNLLEIQNLHIPGVTKFYQSGLTTDNRILLYEMCYDIVKGGGATALIMALKMIYDNAKMRLKMLNEIIEGENQLVVNELITIEKSTVLDDYRVDFTQNSIELLLGQDTQFFFVEQFRT
jgi:hypothetical protein